MTPPRADILVIGGGPAGATAAMALAERGARVVLAEAAAGPRDRVCGEFLSSEAVPDLRRLGIGDEILARRPAQITAARFTAPAGQELLVNLPGPALGISRRLLDEALLRQAMRRGVTVLRGTRFVAPLFDRSGATRGAMLRCGRDLLHRRAGLLIGADGRASPVARSLGLDLPRRRPGRCAIKAHFLPGRGMADLHRQVEIHLFEGGYVGMQRVECGRVNVSAVIAAGLARRLGGGAMAVLLKAAGHNRVAAARLADATPAGPAVSLHPLDRRRAAVCGDGFLLAGDAARVVPPFAGEGISMAIRSGLLCADAAEGALSGYAPREYERSRRQALEPARRASRVLEPLLYRPGLAGPLLGLLGNAPSLAQALVRATRIG